MKAIVFERYGGPDVLHLLSCVVDGRQPRLHGRFELLPFLFVELQVLEAGIEVFLRELAGVEALAGLGARLVDQPIEVYIEPVPVLNVFDGGFVLSSRVRFKSVTCSTSTFKRVVT